MSATNFYEILGVRKDATQEEVRKAYRKRALQTHPDRLPQDASADDKKTAAEHFRLVNNAYEVLNNEDNRKLYDRYNVWPPPADRPEYTRRPSQSAFTSDAFAHDPFFNGSPLGGGGRGRPHAGFAFTDPFELFNSLFGDLHRAFENDPFFAGTPFSRSPFDDPFFRSPFGDPFSRGPFGGGGGGLLFGGGTPFMALMGPGMAFPQLEGGQSNVYSSRTEAVGVNGQWVSRSQMTRTVNGRTEVITKRIDAEGNEHVSYSSPDGERYTINGVEQPARSRPIEGPRRSGTASSSRQPPQPIADAPAQPASHYVPPPQSHAYSVPISGPAPTQAQTQTQVPPPANGTGAAYLDRAHSHRSHRSRPSADDAPRRSHTTPQPTTTPAERPYGGRGSSTGAYDPRTNGGAYASSPTDAYDPRAGSAHGYYAHDRDRDRELRRESVQSHGRDSDSTTHHHHHHRTSESPLASVRSSEKARARPARHEHDSREYYEREREARNGHASSAQRGWRGW
ncbi:hypothetical protein BD413DRAFT_605673 [Trametes elegans]|nr:hypothetical protein BD413DRAFT_605673 [Trametes elegans]